MTWKLWTFVVIMIIEGLRAIVSIDQPQTKTPVEAVGQVMELVFLTWLVLS